MLSSAQSRLPGQRMSVQPYSLPSPAPSLSAPAPAPAPSTSPPAQTPQVFKTRYPLACKECRRRKQKCSLTQPCTNCARRFPQPTCEYGIEKKRSPYAPAAEPGSTSSAAGGLYSHLDMETVRDALVEVEGSAAIGSHLGTPMGVAAVSDIVAVPGQTPTGSSSGPYFRIDGQAFNAESKFRLRLRDKGGLLAGRDIIELLQYILKTRLRVTNSIVKDEWLIDGAELLRVSQANTPPQLSLTRFDEEIRRLPMAPSSMNKELVRTHLQLMSRFKASLDGSPQPNNRFMKHWIPYSIQDPLVLHVVLCSTASFLNETGHIPKLMLFYHRQTVMRMLNEQLADPHRATNDSAMLAVAQMILTSWYWGSTEELHAHMAGFKKMIQTRGDMQSLGMDGYTSKVALIDDFVIALAHETEPLMFDQPGFEFVDPLSVPLLQINFNSPFLFDSPPFLDPAFSLQLHPHTAQILDHIRILFKAVVELPEQPSDEQRDTLCRTAMSVLTLVTDLPAEVPLAAGPEALRGDVTSDAECATSGSKRKRRGDDTRAPRKAGTDRSDARAATSRETPDLVHRCVRKTALVYCHAVAYRLPTSSVCSEAEFAQIWDWAWTVGLSRWATLSGVFAWMMVAIVASSHQSMHGRMTKTLLVTAFMYIGTENWHAAVDMARVALKVQRWLRGGRVANGNGAISAAFGGEPVVERHGFAFKDFRDPLPPGLADAVEDEAASDD